MSPEILVLLQKTDPYLQINHISECVCLIRGAKKRLKSAFKSLKFQRDKQEWASDKLMLQLMNVTSVDSAKQVAELFSIKLQHVQWEIEENNALIEHLASENQLLPMQANSETGIVSRKKRKRQNAHGNPSNHGQAGQLEKAVLDKIERNKQEISRLQDIQQVKPQPTFFLLTCFCNLDSFTHQHNSIRL
jgi:hypothetical protein